MVKMNTSFYAWLLVLVILVALCFVVVGYAIYLHYEHGRFQHLPGPLRSNFWLGNARDIADYRKQGKTFYDYFLTQAIEHGNIFVIFVCHKAIVFVSEPTMIRKLLLRHHLALPKDPKVYRKLGFFRGQPIAGHGLVTNTDEALWKPRRQCLKDAFRRGNIALSFVQTFNNCAQRFLNSLQTKADGKTKVFMLEEFTKVSLLASDQAICGEDSKLTPENFDEILQAFEKCLEAVQANLTSVLPHSLTRFFTRKTSRHREFIEAAKTIRRFAREVIETRERKPRKTRESHTDILAHILDIAKNEPSFAMEEKIDEIVTFFVAAHETTASCLAFTLFEILSNEKIYQRVTKEIDIVIGSRKTFITDQDLGKLHFLHNCVKESLRLYPVVGGPDRILLKDIVVQDYYLPSGCSVFLEKYVAHRNPKYWKNPQTFDPHRFNKRSHSKSSSPGAYFPFSLGPRNCIGKVFAEIQIKLLLVRLFQAYQLRLVPGQSKRMKERLTLRPRDGVACTIRPREVPTRKLRSMTFA